MGPRRPRLLRCSPILASLLAVLSISLFSWGLGYKLSLYHSQHCRPKMAAAKLLSQKERPVTAQSSMARGSSAPISALNLAPLPCLHCSNQMHAPALQAWSPRLVVARELFTTHTNRKPPPNFAG